jgi:Ni,Fe-hydrogenase I cytochrome b subunit
VKNEVLERQRTERKLISSSFIIIGFKELFPAIRLYLFIRKKANKKDTASIWARAFGVKKAFSLS